MNGAAGQVLRVDLSASNDGLSFNVLPKGSQEAPNCGACILQLSLMRTSAWQNEAVGLSFGIGLAGPDLAAVPSGGPKGNGAPFVATGDVGFTTAPEPVMGAARSA